jgi:protein O-mannosyl-transferase
VDAARASSRFHCWLAAAALVAAGVVAYHGSLGGPFIFDDLTSIPKNPNIRSLRGAWSTPTDTTVAGRPFVSFTLALNYAVGGLNPRGYHLLNLALHLGCGLLLLGVVRRTVRLAPAGGLGDSAALAVGFASSSLWIVHPLQTEAVIYVIQRTELLMALTILLTLYAVIRGATGGRRLWGGLAVLSCALGMASKEAMVVCPVVVLIYDQVFLAGSLRAALRARWPLHAALASTWIILALLVAGSPRHASAGFHFSHLTPWDYACTQAGVILRYLRLAIWPSPLVIDYADWPVTRSLLAALPAALGLLTLLAATLVAFARRRPIGFLGVCFFVLLSPTSSFVPILSEPAAERRMYLPLAALVILVVLGARGALGLISAARPRLLAATALLVVLATTLVAGTIHRNLDYRSAEAIWRDVVRKRPANARARQNLGVALLQQRRVAEGIAELRIAIRLAPRVPSISAHLGAALGAAGDLAQATPLLERAVRDDPSDAEAHANLGNVLAQAGELSRALVLYHRAAVLDPHDATVALNMGHALARAGRLDEAEQAFRRSILLDGAAATAHRAIGGVLARQGRLPQARESFERAVALQPDDIDAHNDLGVVLGRLGDFDRAVAQFRIVVAARPDDRQAHGNLALALARLGRLREAQHHLSRARRP